jgi:hypothetical protein
MLARSHAEGVPVGSAKLRRLVTMVSLGVSLAIVGIAGAAAASLSCDENLRGGTTRASVCTTLSLSDAGTPTWLLYALAPTLAFLALAAVPAGRRRTLIPASIIAGVTGVLDAVVVLVGTGKIG